MKKIEILKKQSEKSEGERKKTIHKSRNQSASRQKKQLEQEIKSTKGVYYENKEEIKITLEYLRK